MKYLYLLLALAFVSCDKEETQQQIEQDDAQVIFNGQTFTTFAAALDPVTINGSLRAWNVVFVGNYSNGQSISIVINSNSILSEVESISQTIDIGDSCVIPHTKVLDYKVNRFEKIGLESHVGDLLIMTECSDDGEITEYQFKWNLPIE